MTFEVISHGDDSVGLRSYREIIKLGIYPESLEKDFYATLADDISELLKASYDDGSRVTVKLIMGDRN